MTVIGYTLAALGIFGLYRGDLVLGAILLFVGGFVAGKLFICLRSLGVMLFATALAYGYHHGSSVWVYMALFVGLLLACTRRRRGHSRGGDDGWGIDPDLFSLGDSGGDGWDGDGGGGD